MDSVLEGIKDIQSILDDAKESIEGGVHLRLCNATLAAYQRAEALSGVKNDDRGSVPSEDEDDDEEEESDEEPDRERTEDDMELNELSEWWTGQFDFGRPAAVLDLQFLIWNIVEDTEAKRVCAAVRVLNRALHNAKPDDPADAEKLLEWKEELIAERAIRACAEILEKVDDRVFHNENHDEHWLYSVVCDEILELFVRLGRDDALFRTKMRRNGVLKGMREYLKEWPDSIAGQAVLDMFPLRP
tara:strand:- start:98 stop:829 length:732 start_codon:yes stop_codon:yes gene_type:complete